MPIPIPTCTPILWKETSLVVTKGFQAARHPSPVPRNSIRNSLLSVSLSRLHSLCTEREHARKSQDRERGREGGRDAECNGALPAGVPPRFRDKGTPPTTAISYGTGATRRTWTRADACACVYLRIYVYAVCRGGRQRGEKRRARVQCVEWNGTWDRREGIYNIYCTNVLIFA